MNDRSRRRVAVWLLSGCFLIFSMVVIGGITRLTGSGLSITEWAPIMGAIPPMNDQEWQVAFDKYKQIPQYEKINAHFELADFKAIFWWEYIHRLVGRLIGIVFLLPFAWFLLTKQLDKAMIRKSLLLFALGGLQGFLGWFMVKSGLTERTSVSHIRLAIHLITAFITFGFTWWYALQLLHPRALVPAGRNLRQLALATFSLLLAQIIYGAFVAGLHAGKMHNTFPLMSGQLFPSGGWYAENGIANIFDNPELVQFIHRFFAFALVAMAVLLYRLAGSLPLERVQRTALRWFYGALTLQFILGVLTILYQAPIVLASVHQVGAFFLFASMIYVLFRFRGTSLAT
jgi:cytochrome c oxidase assembly protein subunit 15